MFRSGLLCVSMCLISSLPLQAKTLTFKGELTASNQPEAGVMLELFSDKFALYKVARQLTNVGGFFSFPNVDEGHYCLVGLKGNAHIGSTWVNVKDVQGGYPPVDFDHPNNNCFPRSTASVLATDLSTEPVQSSAYNLMPIDFGITHFFKITENHDRLFISIFCLIACTLTLYPILRFILTTWSFRKDRVFGFLGTGAVVSYYKQFRPGETIASRPDGTSVTKHYMMEFYKDFNRWYGRRYFIAPLTLLTITTLISAFWSFQVLESFSHLGSPPDSMRALVIAALAGGFVWVIADEMDRIRRRDFTTSDVYYYVFRILLAIPFGWALTRITVTLQVGIPLAFFLGAFPTSTLFTLARRFASQQLKLGEDPVSGQLELENLQSVSKANAERFAAEGITTITQLAYADPIDLTIRTNFDFNYIVDCVSQALAWIYLGKALNDLATLSLRGAQEIGDLVDWLQPGLPQTAGAQQTLSDAAQKLKIDPKSLQLTLIQIGEDPYTCFLREIWS